MTYEIKNQEKTVWKRAFAFFRESISDNETDFTVGPIGRALGLLAIPMMLEMGMEAVFAVVDIAFVSRLGTNAIAAVGLTEALITVLYAAAIGLGMAVTAMVSRRIGAKDRDAAAHVTGQAIEDRHGIRQNASQGRTCVMDHNIRIYHSGGMVWRGVPPMAVRESPIGRLVYDLGFLPKE